MRTHWESSMKRLSLAGLALAAVLSLALTTALTACQNVATYTQPTLVRVIDASYMAPGVDVTVQGTLLATDIGQGIITPYGTFSSQFGALLKVVADNGGALIASTNGTLLAGQQHSLLLTDNGQSSPTYGLTLLTDQQTGAPAGHSEFRFINQALNTGAVDVYLVPANSSLANAIPVVTDLAVGGVTSYISFASQSLTMVVTPTGTTTAKYTSSSMTFNGGEVRTALIVDTQLTYDPPVTVYIGNDVN